MNNLKVTPICFLFGHTAGANDSGFNVCGRCGLHSYYNADEYNQLLSMNLLYIRHLMGIDNLIWSIRLRLRKWTNDLPF